MKPFLINAGSKLRRFFWSWGFLKFVLWALTIIVFIYVEENWRGARAWATTKAGWEAKGESFDFNKFIPPSIPEDQNLAAIPLFKLEADPENKTGVMRPFALEKALEHFSNPPMGNWQKGELPDMEKIRVALASEYTQVFNAQPPNTDLLAQLEALRPFIIDLQKAAAQRGACRFQVDYTVSPPFSRSMELMTRQMTVAQVLKLHAILALQNHQPDVALADIRASFRLVSGMRRDPSLIGGLVAQTMVSVTSGAVYNGLAGHAWNDGQLAEIGEMYGSIDCLSDYQFAMRGETVTMALMMDWVKSQPRANLAGLLAMNSDTGSQDIGGVNFPFGAWPGGWLDLSKAQMIDFDLSSLGSVDVKARRFFPEVANRLYVQAEERKAKPEMMLPWNLLPSIAAPSLTGVGLKFAESQVWIDQVRIACALERYRLAKGAYPASLNELAPAYLAEVPQDIMNGEPYHYQARTDGTFLLYSVGWNQKDDGGTVATQNNDAKTRKSKEGDWTWPTPGIAATN